MSLRVVARFVVVLVVLLVFQVAVLDDLVVFGAHPDALVLVAPAVGLRSGARRGALLGFCAGLVADLVVSLPFGLSALCYVLVGFGVGVFSSSAARSDSRLTECSVLVLAAGAATILYGVIGAVIGQPDMVGRDLASAVVTVILGAVVLSYPVLWFCSWALSGSEREVALSSMPSGGSAR